MTTAVIGATGTAGSRVVTKLRDQDDDPVQVSRSTGVDLISGQGLDEALARVDTAIDTSNAFPSDERLALQDALTAATRHVVQACTRAQVKHLVFLSIAGIENPVFDAFDYYLAKRAQERVVAEAGVPATVVKSTQWHEFATNPAAVAFDDQQVLVEDWLIQPIAADTVADELIDVARRPASAQPRSITGPEAIRLPELTRQLLARRGDPRPVRSTAPALPALAEGALLAPADAAILGPDITSWLTSPTDP